MKFIFAVLYVLNAREVAKQGDGGPIDPWPALITISQTVQDTTSVTIID